VNDPNLTVGVAVCCDCLEVMRSQSDEVVGQQIRTCVVIGRRADMTDQSVHDLYEKMSSLRAVRRLRPDPIDDAVLERVLQAAAWAPTGGISSHGTWWLFSIQ
jgi:hypothetical protein